MPSPGRSPSPLHPTQSRNSFSPLGAAVVLGKQEKGRQGKKKSLVVLSLPVLPFSRRIQLEGLGAANWLFFPRWIPSILAEPEAGSGQSVEQGWPCLGRNRELGFGCWSRSPGGTVISGDGEQRYHLRKSGKNVSGMCWILWRFASLAEW